MRDIKKLSKEELKFLAEKKPDLVPMKVPSLNEVNLLSQPSIDQIIIEFLKQYEVNVQPRSVGAWNGWDTLSAASALSTAIFAERGENSIDIGSTLFMANRSNQINSAAQEWGTWKRWALDHKNFEKFKDDVIQSINKHNKVLIEQTETQIRLAELNNQKVLKALQEPFAKNYIAQLIKKNQLTRKTQLKTFWLLILGLTTFGIFFAIIDNVSGNYEKRQKIQKIKQEKLAYEFRIAEYKRVKKLVSEFSSALATYEDRPNKNSIKMGQILKEIPTEYYSSSEIKKILINYFVHLYNESMGGKYSSWEDAREDIKKWCNGDRIFNIVENHYTLQEIPLREKIIADRSYWKQRIDNFCTKVEMPPGDQGGRIWGYPKLEFFQNY